MIQIELFSENLEHSIFYEDIIDGFLFWVLLIIKSI